MCFCGNGFSFSIGKRTYVMGILNITPDSFSDGGAYFSPLAAIERAKELAECGADIVDIGACSTAPGNKIVDSKTEIERLKPVLSEICMKTGVPVSVDTFHPETMRFALESGTAIINDISGVVSAEKAKIIKDFNAGWIITHASETTAIDGEDIVSRVNRFFNQSLDKAIAFGLKREQLCLDVGIGFGKSRSEDLELLKRADEIDSLGVALLYGASRKRIIGVLTGEDNPKKRLAGTLAAHISAAIGGADIVRTHDVFEAVQSLRTADALSGKSDIF